MRFGLCTLALAASATAIAKKKNFVYYFDQDNFGQRPPDTSGITHAVMNYISSEDVFNTTKDHKPDPPLGFMRFAFDNTTKFCLGIGGWGDHIGWSQAINSTEKLREFADKADRLVRKGRYDCLAIDWLYPGGNGEMYMKIPNELRGLEIESFPWLLAKLKRRLKKKKKGSQEVEKDLLIMAPGRMEDMLAYSGENMKVINEAADMVNIMAYDYMSPRSNVTTHHTGIEHAKRAAELYIARGIDPSKLNLGFAWYAKWAATALPCRTPENCPLIPLQDYHGDDTGFSGTLTFEEKNLGLGKFLTALENGMEDEIGGGQWWFDDEEGVYWSWETGKLVERKMEEIVGELGLGGVMAYKAGWDSWDWSRYGAMHQGVKKANENAEIEEIAEIKKAKEIQEAKEAEEVAKSEEIKESKEDKKGKGVKKGKEHKKGKEKKEKKGQKEKKASEDGGNVE